MKTWTLGQRVGWAVRDTYFVVGLIIVVLLVLMAVFGPSLAPHNPFLVKPIQWIDGELHKAPFLPGKLYPLGTDELGRDQLSLLLYGASTTLIMAVIAMVIRMLLGLLLGTFSGWWPGSLFDRSVTTVTEFLASIPGLILAMLLVFAVGIHRGQAAFIVALALVGFGEVAQIMRGHVMTIRNEQYIDAARAVGLSSPGILSRHVLPNLMGTLLALAALEMAGVLLLLGELGFLSIFIGGGRSVFSEAAWDTYHSFDVPDWGAMLGTSWRWFRSYPWLPLAPAAAFFIAIVGFNLFGYGLQRFVERGRFHPSGWSVLRFFAVVALILVGARALMMGTGVEAQFAGLIRDFDAERALEDVEQLAQFGSDQTSVNAGQPSRAASYIAAQFEEAELSLTTPDGSYLHEYTLFRGRKTAEPVLEVLDAAGGVRLRLEEGISLDPWQAFSDEGSREAELLVAANASRLPPDAIVLALDPTEKFQRGWLANDRYEGILRLVPDDKLAGPEVVPVFDTTSYGSAERLPIFPNLLIGASAAGQVLDAAGLDLKDVQARGETGKEMLLETGLRVRLSYGLVYEESTGTNVVGYVAGEDIESRGQRILVAADYSHIGADQNASAVAAMLEMARMLQEIEFFPKRTIVFAAFDEGGDFDFVIRPSLPTGRSDLWTAVIVDGIGAGDRRLARLEEGAGLARTFDQSARRFGVRTTDLDEWRFFFVTNDSRLSWSEPRAHDSYLGLAVTRPGDDLSGTPSDTSAHLDLEQLQEAAQAILHYVMVLSYR